MVDRFMAFGSITLAFNASKNHFSNCCIGSGNIDETSNDALEYSLRSFDKSYIRLQFDDKIDKEIKLAQVNTKYFIQVFKR